MVVHGDRPGRPEGDAGGLGELDDGSGPDAEHDDVGGQLEVPGDDLRRRGVTFDGGHHRIDVDDQAHGAHPVGDLQTEVGVEGPGQDRRGGFDDGHVPSFGVERLGDLEADVAASDDDRVPLSSVGHLAERLGIAERPQGVHSVEVDAGDRRHEGPGAGGDEQLVVAVLERPVGFEVVDRHGPGCGVDGDDLVPEPEVDAGPGELLGGPGDEVLELGHVPGDVVGLTARGVARPRRALVGDDIEVAIASPRHRRGGHPGRVGADHHEFPAHRPPPSREPRRARVISRCRDPPGSPATGSCTPNHRSGCRCDRRACRTASWTGPARACPVRTGRRPSE